MAYFLGDCLQYCAYFAVCLASILSPRARLHDIDITLGDEESSNRDALGCSINMDDYINELTFIKCYIHYIIYIYNYM